MINKEVVISKDRITIKGDTTGLLNNGIVMDKVAKNITKEFCKVVGQEKGHVLDIGFGLGYSAQYFYNMGVKSYTCIEINQDIYETALEWAQDKHNVTIILGDWFDIIPTLDKKYDGIFMDTYGDDLNKYRQFESYVVPIANQNAILSIYEYEHCRLLKDLNYKAFEWINENYNLALKPFHRVCWTYLVGDKFRKNQWFRQVKLDKHLTDELFELNTNQTFTRETSTALVDGIAHTRKLDIAPLIPTKKLVRFLEKNFYPHHKIVNIETIGYGKIHKYSPGDRFDRHIETIKDLPILDKDQFTDCFIITLNDNFKGGELELFDNWIEGDRNHSVIVQETAGTVTFFKPYHHAQLSPVLNGNRYEIYLLLRHSDIKHKEKHLI